MEISTPRYRAGSHSLFHTGVRAARAAYYNRQDIREIIAQGRRAFGSVKRAVEQAIRYKKYRGPPKDIVPRSVPKMGKYRSGPGQYSGRFKGRSKITRKGMFAVKGYRTHNEVYGQVTQPHVAVVGTYSVPRPEIGKAVGIALLRYALYKQYNRHVADQLEPIDHMGAPSSTAINGIAKVRLHYVTDPTPTNNPNYGYVDYDTYASMVLPSQPSSWGIARFISDFGDWFETNIFRSQQFGGLANSAGFLNQITAINFVEYASAWNVVTDAPDERYQATITAHIPINKLIIKAYALCKLTIQNITPADTAGTTDGNLSADRIDSNPLNGRIYRFRGILPEVASKVIDRLGASDLSRDPNAIYAASNAAPLLRAKVHTENDWMATPPAPDSFSNCISSIPVRLNPGQIKDFSVKFTYDGTLSDLILGCARTDSTSNELGGIQGRRRAFGTSSIICLEKTMRTGATNIVLNYHLDWMVGAAVKKSVRVGMPKAYKLLSEVDINAV